MPTPKIPIRPKKGKYQLSNEEMDCLAWYVISGCKKEHAYKTFVRPDLVVSPMVLGKETKKFFDLTESRNFLSDYTRTLNGEVIEEGERPQPKSREQRKAEAVASFEDKVVDKMIGDLDSVEDMDAIAKLADRVGVLAEKEAHVEAPRRYLPERCNDCRYKKFIEENVKLGNIVDDERLPED